MQTFNEYYNKFLKEKLLTKEAPTGYSTGIQGKPKQEVVPMNNKIEKTDVLKNKDEVADKEEAHEDNNATTDDEYQRILMRKSTAKGLGVNAPTLDSATKQKFDNYEKTNKRGKYSGSKVRQSVDFDEDQEEPTMDQLLNIMTEARIVHPDVDYVEVERPKGNVTKVIAKLASYKGGVWTRLNKEYVKLVEETRALEEKTKNLNLRITDKIQNETFDPADELYTRVVETKDALFQLTKAYTQSRTSVNRKGIIENMPRELYEKLDFVTEEMIPELTQAIALIIDAYTTTKEVPVKPRLTPTLKEPKETNESITENTKMDKLATMVNKFLDNYDNKLNYISNI